MSLTTDEALRNESLRDIARQMMVAARTAPKGRGRDTLTIALAEGDTLMLLADKMHEIGERENAHFFIRDAENLRQSSVAVLIGSRISAAGTPACGYCGFRDCAEKNQHPTQPCYFNTVDLGIAVSSAVSVASACKADNRIMFSVGKAAIELELLGADVKLVLGIPLTATAKSPFFDRK